MRLIVRHPDGSIQAAIMVATIGARMRAFVPGCDDAVEFRLADGRWLAENGQAVEIRFDAADDEFDSLAQYAADVDTQKRTLELSQSKLDRERKQLEATKIYAPQDGLVVYASAGGGHFSSESMIEEGAVVRNRQDIIKLPDVSEMKLRVKIHESHVNQVHPDQPAFVVLDSMPDQRFQGVVAKVAPLPDTQARWGNPDLKVYATEILVTERREKESWAGPYQASAPAARADIASNGAMVGSSLHNPGSTGSRGRPARDRVDSVSLKVRRGTSTPPRFFSAERI